MRSNIDAVVKAAAGGMEDPHPRVRYAGLFCLSQFLVQLKPLAQRKYHADLVPALLTLIETENANTDKKPESAKMVTQALVAMVNFVQGLIQEDDNEIEETKKSGDIMLLYSDRLFNALVENLKVGI